MSRQKKSWSYSAGERGRNRVRAFEHPKGILMLEFSLNGDRKRISLGHSDKAKAKEAADQAAAELTRDRPLRPKGRSLKTLFDNYSVEVTPTKAPQSQKYDLRTLQMFMEFWGANRDPMAITIREWSAFIRDRRAGRVSPAGAQTPVRDRVIEQDLKLLKAVFNWATQASDGSGGFLLDRNPVAGFQIPKEKNPRRPTLSNTEYEALKAVASSVDWRFYVALVLAHETGHRIGAIRSLRWSDVDLQGRLIRWRAEHDKSGHEHVTPMTESAMGALRLAQSHSAGIGEAPVLPAPQSPSDYMSRSFATKLWRRAEQAAGLPAVEGRGWHSLRRMFASELKEVPMAVLMRLGGWKSAQTVLTCYQQVQANEMRAALQQRAQSG